MFTILVLAACGVAVLAQDPSIDCPAGWAPFGNSCYGYVDNPQSWAQAQATCAALGGFLAEILSDQGRVHYVIFGGRPPSARGATAEATCAALGGFVVEILTDQENQFIQKMAQDHDHHTIWLGADDLLVEGTWYWAKSGAKLDEYTDWAAGQPDNGGDENCMEMNVDNFSSHWNDDQCDHHQRYICQKYMNSEIIG